MSEMGEIRRVGRQSLGLSEQTETGRHTHRFARTVAPLGDAVRLVDDEAREKAPVLEPTHALEHGLGARELLRGDVQELQPVFIFFLVCVRS